jgi:hypothetical protein
MSVHRSNGSLANTSSACGGTEPCSEIIPIGATVKTSNASIFTNNRSSGNGNAFPRPIISVTIASSTDYELWRSDTGQPQNYRTEVVEWPVANSTLWQNYYRLYENINALTPIDPWPAGAPDLGENTAMTELDSPIADGGVIRLRMSAVVHNATLPELTKSMKLQYGKRTTTCSAISVWTDVGPSGSGVIWRGYDNTGVADGTAVATSTPAPGALLISVSDVAGTYTEENDSAANPYSASAGQDIEYDWAVQDNGALQRTDYCFRMVESDGTLLSGYNYYPTVQTTGYTPVTENWRWYNDATSTTPTIPLAAENVAPSDIANNNAVKLRVAVNEIENEPGSNVKFKLQFSQYSNFSHDVHDVVSTTTCKADSIWCYADGGGPDGSLIDTNVLTDTDSCVGGSGDGCGTYNHGTATPSTLSQPALSHMEFDFSVKNAGARINRVYYFRLYDTANDKIVLASSTYPSLSTEGGSLAFTISGVASSTTIDDETTDVGTSPTTIAFGNILLNTPYVAAQNITVETNATEGYQVLMSSAGGLVNAYGDRILPIVGTNAAPVAWSIGCAAGVASCFGYHTDDATLEGGSTRFSAVDTYAHLSTSTPDEVAYSPLPETTDTTYIIYKLEARQLQGAGKYETGINYIATPVF